MDIKSASDEELCKLYSRHLLSPYPNMVTVKDCLKELEERGLKLGNMCVSVKFGFLDEVKEPVTIHLTEGVIKELWF